MPHYDKLPRQREAAVDDAPAEATPLLSWEAAQTRAQTELTRQRKLRNLSSTAVEALRELLELRKNGTRTAETTQDEIAELCGICSRQAGRLVRQWKSVGLIEVSRRGREKSYYHFSSSILPDYLLDAPQPKKIPPKSPLFGNDEAVPIRPPSTDDRTRMSDRDCEDRAKMSDQDTGHKGTRARALARQLDIERENSLSTYLADKPLSIESPEAYQAGIEAVWAKLRSYYPQTDRKGAQRLVLDFRENQGGDVTFSEICHCIGELGDFEKQNPRIDSLGGFLIAEVPRRYPGSLLAEYRKQQDRQLRLDLNQETEACQREGEAKDNERLTEGDVEMSPAAVAHQERERQAHAKELADWLRSQALWLARKDATKGYAERMEQIAQQVERLEPGTSHLEDSLAGIRSEIQGALYEMSTEDDLERVRSYAAKRGTHLHDELLGYWSMPTLRIPEKLLRAWREIRPAKPKWQQFTDNGAT